MMRFVIVRSSKRESKRLSWVCVSACARDDSSARRDRNELECDDVTTSPPQPEFY